MPEFATPAISKLVAELGPNFLWAQVAVSAEPAGKFRLVHVEDQEQREGLRAVRLEELRGLASENAAGAFRPLRSSPDLRRGWELHTGGLAELERALDLIYPNSVSDWMAARQSDSPVTHYREFTARQTGMYRITQLLTDQQAAAIARAVCHPRFCLKKRLWSVPGAGADTVPPKALLPCLEPCAILLESARKGMRIEQEEKIKLEVAPSDWATVRAALEAVAAGQFGGERAGDFGDPLNGRRVQLALEKYQPGVQTASGEE